MSLSVQALDKDAAALEYAILSTSDEETLTYIASKIVDNLISSPRINPPGFP